MSDKTPPDRTVAAPADASAASAAENRPADALTTHLTGLLRTRQWYELPRLLAYGRLVEIRNELREKNLHDTEEPAFEKVTVPPAADQDPAIREARTTDGSSNDLQYPRM